MNEIVEVEKKEFKINVPEELESKPIVVIERKNTNVYSNIHIYIGKFISPDCIENFDEIILEYENSDSSYRVLSENKYSRKILSNFTGPVKFYRKENIDMLSKEKEFSYALKGIEEKLQKY